MRKYLVFVLFLFCIAAACGDERPTIDTLAGKRLILEAGFAGEGLVLTKKGNEYFVERTFYGSGVPEIGKITYRIIVDGKYQIRFSEPVALEGSDMRPVKQEEFRLGISDEGTPMLYLNGVRVMVTVIE